VPLEELGYVLEIVSPFIDYIPSIADFDADGDVDLVDFTYFQACFAGSEGEVSTECAHADLDFDQDVDMQDFIIFQQEYTGS